MLNEDRKSLASLYSAFRSYREGITAKIKVKTWLEARKELLSSLEFPRELSALEKALPRDILALLSGIYKFKKMPDHDWEFCITRFTELYTLRCLDRIGC